MMIWIRRGRSRPPGCSPRMPPLSTGCSPRSKPGFDLGEQPVESGGMRGEQPGGLDLPRRIQIIIAELVEEVLHLRELLQRRIAGILEGERPADVTLVRRMHALELLESRSDRRNGGPIRERLDPPEVRHSTRPRWDPRIRPA